MRSEDSIVGFDPVAQPDALALVLGSFPSVRSLAATEYYAHPQNAFWTIMGELFGAGRDRPYLERLQVLLEARVALWDVARACQHRIGSADATMRGIEANDVAGLVSTRCPGIRGVFCNGRKAEELFRRLVLPTLDQGIEVHYLPSSSAAHAGMGRDEKLRRWSILKAFVRREH